MVYTFSVKQMREHPFYRFSKVRERTPLSLPIVRQCGLRASDALPASAHLHRVH